MKLTEEIQKRIDELAENFPNAYVTIEMINGVQTITQIDIDGKYTRAMDQEAREIRQAIEDNKGLNERDFRIPLK